METQCYCTSLRSAARRIATVYDRALEPVGVNIAQFALLRAIARGEPVALTELGRRIELDRSTVGRNIRVLERMGFVATQRRESDQRKATVSLSSAGLRALEEGAPLWDEVQTGIEARLGSSTAQGLRAVLNGF